MQHEFNSYDVLGLGFGPANLAIAAAITEKWTIPQNGGERPIRSALFIEKHSGFHWHPGMLIPGSQMQISCMKDLATLRNPSSAYTFLAYLHAQNRLITFINRGSTIPTRREYADYLSWAAGEVEKRGVRVAYSEEVIGISKIDSEENSQYYIEVTSQRVGTGELIKRRTKNLIVSGGGSPHYPSILAPLASPANGPRVPIFHTSAYITSVVPVLQTLAKGDAPLKIAVVGAGQSATEVLLDLQRRLEAIPCKGQHEIHMLIRKGSLKPSDDSPFVNEIFDPDTTDKVYNLPSTRLRDTIRAEYINTNYSVVNPRTLDAVYEVIYDQKLHDSIVARSGRKPLAVPPRIVLRTYQNIVNASTTALPLTESIPNPSSSSPAVTITCQDVLSREISETTYNAVICGTGYDRQSWSRLIRASNLAKQFGLASEGGDNVDATLHEDAVVRLVPEAGEPHDEQIRFNFINRAYGGNNNGNDIVLAPSIAGKESVPALSRSDSCSSSSTPPTSPTLSAAVPPTLTARISRRYRLLACDQEHASESWNGRIYLQGCSEATHGLSDTLLSVLGVKAGEVVDDIWGSGAEASLVA